MAKAKEVKSLSLVKLEQYWIISQNYSNSNRKEIKERKFISTGVYILDALSAKMLGGGISTNRISAFAGESGSGKSFLAYSCSKNAQKMDIQ
jgi:RecA/RadA recombinase